MLYAVFTVFPLPSVDVVDVDEVGDEFLSNGKGEDDGESESIPIPLLLFRFCVLDGMLLFLLFYKCNIIYIIYISIYIYQ